MLGLRGLASFEFCPDVELFTGPTHTEKISGKVIRGIKEFREPEPLDTL
jgi:hypothetical protein